MSLALRSRRLRRLAPLLSILVSAALVVGFAPPAPAVTPFGPQNLLVVLIERQHTGCPADSTGDPTCPRYTAAQWQTILQRDLNAWYSTETYGQTSWNVHVLADPDTTDGWWPAPHTQAEYAGNDNFWDNPSVGRDAAETIPGMALQRGILSLSELTSTHRVLMIDNYHRRGGQTNGVNSPIAYYPTYSIGPFHLSIPFPVTVSVTAEDSNDTDALSVIEHELGHQLGEPDLYSQTACPNQPPGAPAETHTGDDSDCVGPWDHMALDYSDFPGFGGYTKQRIPWLNPDPLGPSVQDVPSTFSGTVNLDPIEHPQGGKLILQVPQDIGAVVLARFFGVVGPYKGLMVECRRRLGDDTGIPAEGALVSWLDPTRGNDHPQDVARGSTTQTASTAMLSTVGASYSNASLHVTLRYEGATADGGCAVDVNRTRYVYPHYAVGLAALAAYHQDASGIGGTQSFSAFAGTGVMLNGGHHTAGHGRTSATLARRLSTAAGSRGGKVKVSPLLAHHRASISFSYGNAGNKTARSGTAVVRVQDPYTVSVCGPAPKGRVVARVPLKKLKPGKTATQVVHFVPRDTGPVGVTVQIKGKGKGLSGTAETESGVLGFASATLHKKKSKPAKTKLTVSSAKSCGHLTHLYLQPLVSPTGWTFTTKGLTSPLAPGDHRKVTVVETPPAHAKAQSLDIPVTVMAGALPDPAPHGTFVPPYLIGEPDFVAGFDLLTRASKPGHRPPPFVLAGPPPPLQPVSYPTAPPGPQAATLTLTCPNGVGVGQPVTTTGALSPAEAGAQVALAYTHTQPVGPGAIQAESTSANGSFSDTFVPSAGGAWTVQAFFGGTGEDAAAASNLCHFGVG